MTTQDLSVTYGTVVAVDRVSLQVERGSICGLLGPNGAGKTSMIRALTTIVPVAGGTATIVGHPLTDPVAVRSSIGVLPESNGYPGAQTALGYLRFYGQLYGMEAADAEQRALQLLQQFGLSRGQARISTFSRGMRQRLGLARALIHDPAVLFLDEPTLGLDPAGKEEIMVELARLAVERGTTIFLCTHLLDEVERICDQVAIMNHGQVVAEGTVDEIVDSSGAEGFARIRVRPEDVPVSDEVLRGTEEVRAVRFDNTRPGDLVVTIDNDHGAAATSLRALLDAGVEPRSFDFRGARLSDAFMALTSGRAGGDKVTEGVSQ
ncbi:MAG: ABC transporter ATP-binding protein [Acidimicrobiia bacterium]|nr:ABC transporter ATP-binding protein [Acidimicrobiia bacterium]